MNNFDWKVYSLNYPQLGLTSKAAAIRHYLVVGKKQKLVTNQLINKVFELKINRLPEEELKLIELPPRLGAGATSIDLRSMLPPCYDQGNIGSCTANALIAAYQYLKPVFMGSRLFLYYNERVLENSTKFDAGAYLYDGVKTMIKNGVCAESEWPYIPNKFSVKPLDVCYKSALDHQVLQAFNVTQTLDQMKACLSAGFPFVVGILCYNAFVSTTVARNGIVSMPAKNERPIGGHAILIVGYDDGTKRWIFRNSWGATWGDRGYGYLPYEYLTSKTLSSDLWTLRLVE
jgi:C1A family cysteine protease